jgi:hypothetical protein
VIQKELFEWVRDNGGEVGPIELARVPGDNSARRGILASEAFRKGDRLLFVPSTLLLNLDAAWADSVFHAAVGEHTMEHGAWVALEGFGETSTDGSLNNFESGAGSNVIDPVPPLLRPTSPSGCRNLARLHEIWRAMRDAGVLYELQKAVDSYLFDDGKPSLAGQGVKPGKDWTRRHKTALPIELSFDAFVWAAAMVRTRAWVLGGSRAVALRNAFSIDDEGMSDGSKNDGDDGVRWMESLIPVADLLNHAHGADGGRLHPVESPKEPGQRVFRGVAMNASAAVGRGKEIFTSYDEAPLCTGGSCSETDAGAAQSLTQNTQWWSFHYGFVPTKS